MTPPTVNAYYSSIENKIGEDFALLPLLFFVFVRCYVYFTWGYSTDYGNKTAITSLGQNLRLV